MTSTDGDDEGYRAATAEVIQLLKDNGTFWKLGGLAKATLDISQPATKTGSGKGSSIHQQLYDWLQQSENKTVLLNAIHHKKRAQDVRFAARELVLPRGVTAPTSKQEPIYFIQKHQEVWKRKMLNRIHTIAKSTHPPLNMATLRSQHMRGLAFDKLVEQITEVPLQMGMYIYDSADLVKEMTSLVNQNYSLSGYLGPQRQNTIPQFGLMKAMLSTPTFEEIRKRLCDLALENTQYGIDNEERPSAAQEHFINSFNIIAHKIINSGSAKQAEAFAQRGVPTHHRPAIWDLVLLPNSKTIINNNSSNNNHNNNSNNNNSSNNNNNSNTNYNITNNNNNHANNNINDNETNDNHFNNDDDYNYNNNNNNNSGNINSNSNINSNNNINNTNNTNGYAIAHYNQLCEQVRKHTLLVDHLITAESKILANRDDNYFVFEEQIKQTLLVMTRDTSIYKSMSHPRPFLLQGSIEGSKTGATVSYPPSGVIPFRGISLYVAPLCFVYADPVKLYQVFVALYTRFFCQLHTITSASEGLVRLSCLFEKLLEEQEPLLCLHFIEIRFDPLIVALPWISQAFSGVLQPDQVLLLWDRIIGCDTVVVLPLLAVAIFSFRRTALFACDSSKDAEKVLADCVALKSTTLLQCFLFGGKKD